MTPSRSMHHGAPLRTVWRQCGSTGRRGLSATTHGYRTLSQAAGDASAEGLAPRSPTTLCRPRSNREGVTWTMN